jgi:hypothetical protein
MSFGSLSEVEHALYANRVPTVDRTRVSRTRPSVAGVTDVRQPASSPPQNSGAIDHWSIVLLYSLGFGTVAVAALLFLVLMVVSLYGQLVWSFTYWDLANVSLTPFKSLAYFILLGTFVGGTCVGLWCFSGAAWRKSTSTATRRRTR